MRARRLLFAIAGLLVLSSVAGQAETPLFRTVSTATSIQMPIEDVEGLPERPDCDRLVDALLEQLPEELPDEPWPSIAWDELPEACAPEMEQLRTPLDDEQVSP